jgi:hypothetical protein
MTHITSDTISVVKASDVAPRDIQQLRNALSQILRKEESETRFDGHKVLSLLS